jgi:hypothetical protein
MAVSYFQTQCVWINVYNNDGNFPQLPSDEDGVVERLRKYMKENNIWPQRGLTSGPTFFSALFSIEDGATIIEFLKAIGVPERQ